MGDFFATTAKGMEPFLADELRALGASSVEERRAGVAFAGALEIAYRACLWSRTASRVLLPLARFAAADEEALYRGVRAIDWGQHLGPRDTLAVDFATSHSGITHSHFGALKTKDAIVDRFRDETGARPSVDTAAPDVRVNVYLHEDVATVGIDLSGESLHRRGYRDGGRPGVSAPAPLKENLAATILYAARWPELARAGVPLVDPMCGSGTLPIEAALLAADVAPGLGRARWGFSGWRGHDRTIWSRLVEEAEARRVRDPRRVPPIVGWDVDPRAVRTALAHVEKAGLRGFVHVEKRALADAAPVAARAPGQLPVAGVLVVNPPYGERLGEEAELTPLYQQLGDVLRRRFMGWRAHVLTGNLELAKAIGLRPERRLVLYNGAIECRLLDFPISTAPVEDVPGAPGPAWRREPRPPSPKAQGAPHELTAGAEMFANRLSKRDKHVAKWAKREGVHCYRVYDADLPEYAVAVDRYEDAVHVQEYAPPATVDAAMAEARLRDVMAVLPRVLGVEARDVFLKVRRRQRGGTQYERQADQRAERVVREADCRFVVNLSDYLDTGLFLDHRRLRALIRQLAAGRDFLNLFAYTATATVMAAKGGARSTTSVDLSNTYLDWARRNLDENGLRGPEHGLVRADVLEWLPRQSRRWGLIFVAPPTFSNSKRMEDTFDVQRDHAALLRACATLLTPDGVLLFSNHLRKFKLDGAELRAAGLAVENITRETLPVDFERNPRIHNSWRIRVADDGG